MEVECVRVTLWGKKSWFQWMRIIYVKEEHGKFWILWSYIVILKDSAEANYLIHALDVRMRYDQRFKFYSYGKVMCEIFIVRDFTQRI